jgi:hypothetical protein
MYESTSMDGLPAQIVTTASIYQTSPLKILKNLLNFVLFASDNYPSIEKDGQCTYTLILRFVRDRRCCGKAINITHWCVCVCVCVCARARARVGVPGRGVVCICVHDIVLISQHATRRRHLLISVAPLSPVPSYFSTLSHERQGFLKTLLNMESVLIFSATFV